MTDPRDFALRATIARDGAPLARPVRKPDPPARPAYVPPPAAIADQLCDPCGLPLVRAQGSVERWECRCGWSKTLHSVTSEPGYGVVKTWVTICEAPL